MDAGRDIDMSGSGTRGPPPDTIENTNTSCPRSILDDFDTVDIGFTDQLNFKLNTRPIPITYPAGRQNFLYSCRIGAASSAGGS